MAEIAPKLPIQKLKRALGIPDEFLVEKIVLEFDSGVPRVYVKAPLFRLGQREPWQLCGDVCQIVADVMVDEKVNVVTKEAES